MVLLSLEMSMTLHARLPFHHSTESIHCPSVARILQVWPKVIGLFHDISLQWLFQISTIRPKPSVVIHCFEDKHPYTMRENDPGEVHRGQKLLDEESRGRLPALYSGEEIGLKAKAVVKFFTPDSNWTWYASEFDGNDLFFGLVIGFEIELGYFSLSELSSARGPLGLPIERDLYFESKSLQDLFDEHKRARGQ